MPSDDGERRKRRGGRSDIPWADIRAAYEAGETNISALSKRFSVKRDSIAKRRDKEKWATTGQIADTIRSNVIDIATKRAIDKLGGEEAVAAQAALAIAETLEAQVPLFAKAARLLDKTFERALNLGMTDEKGDLVKNRLVLGEHQGETTAVSDLLNALSKFTRDTRLINGLRDGVANTEAADDEADKPKADQVVLVVRDRKQTA